MIILPHRRAAFSYTLPTKRFTAPTSGSDGDLIGTLIDTGLLAQNATASGSARPTLRVGVVNGKNAVESNGTSNSMSFSAVSSAGDWTIIAVQRRQGANPAAIVGNSGGVLPPYSALEYPALGKIFVANRTSQKDAAIPTQAWHVLTTTNSGGAISLRIDGSPVTLSSTYPDSGTGNFDRLFSRFSEFWAVRMADTLMFDSALSLSACHAWEARLGDLYGITISA